MNIFGIEKPNFNFYEVKDQLKRFVYERSKAAFAAGDRARDEIKTKAQLRERQQFIRDTFLTSIGGLPQTEAPLSAEVLGVEQQDAYRIEKIIFQSRPRVYVTANMYIPNDIPLSKAKAPATMARRGAVLFLSGHSNEAKHSERYHTVCQFLVRAGLIVFSMDPIGQGERQNYMGNDRTLLTESYLHEHPGTQCWPLGDGLARYFLHDAMRAIDYLLTRPEVDPQKIGVTGSSGGGTQTAMMMMGDPRIAAAAPATYVTSREAYIYSGQPQDAEQIWPGFTAAGLDHEDLMIVMAPRPVRVLAVNYDIFPIEGTRRTVERTRRFWEMFGKGHCVDLYEDPHVHMYTNRLAQAAAEFFSQHLLGETCVPAIEEIEPVPPAQLICTAQGQVLNQYAKAMSIHDELVIRLNEIQTQAKRPQDAKRRDQASAWLNNRVRAGRLTCELNPRHLLQQQVDEMSVQNSLWWSQEGLMNYGLMFRHYQYESDCLPVTIAIWSGGTSRLQRHLHWIRKTCREGRAVFVLDVSGVGLLQPYPFYVEDALAPYGTISKITTDLMFLGDSLAAMRIYDVLRAVDLVRAMDRVASDGIRLYGNGRYALYAELAAFLEQRIQGVNVENGMRSVAELVRLPYYDQYDVMGLILPGMLKYFDLPDVRKWLAE